MTKMNSKNVVAVLRKLADTLEGDAEMRTEAFCAALNRFLDELKNEDFFGTEGQLDPRGDPRG